MKILLTGAAGFIGSHIAERLLQERYTILGLDNFDSYYHRSLKELNLQAVQKTPTTNNYFAFIDCDILNYDKVSSLIEDIQPDIIIHCAARAGVRSSVQQPRTYMQINVTGTQNLLEAVRLHSPKTRFITLSSSSIYGIQAETPFHEEQHPNPLSPYGASKYAMELIIKQYALFYDIQTAVVRPFSIYGPRGRIDMAPFLVIRAGETGKTFVQFGKNSDNKRDWTYIDDFVHGIHMLVENKPKELYDIFNFGNSTPIGIDDFIQTHTELLQKYFKIKLDLKKQKRSREELPITYADITKAEKYGYQPKTKFAEGLEKLYQFYRANRAHYQAIW